MSDNAPDASEPATCTFISDKFNVPGWVSIPNTACSRPGWEDADAGAAVRGADLDEDVDAGAHGEDAGWPAAGAKSG